MVTCQRFSQAKAGGGRWGTPHRCSWRERGEERKGKEGREERMREGFEEINTDLETGIPCVASFN
jgi:hypothetical protein